MHFFHKESKSNFFSCWGWGWGVGGVRVGGGGGVDGCTDEQA